MATSFKSSVTMSAGTGSITNGNSTAAIALGVPSPTIASGASVSANATLSLTVVTTASNAKANIQIGASSSSFTTVYSAYQWGTSAGTYTPSIAITLPSDVITALKNNQAIYLKFTVTSGNMRINAGAEISVTGSYEIVTSACGAPTTTSLPASVAESDPTLTWSGASSGNNNAITGYEIQYCDSSNGSSWGSWNALSTVSSTAASGSATVALPTARGYYRKYRIRTQGSAGSSYYSAWKETSSVRKNTIPGAAASVAVSPSLYSTDNVTLTWSGVVAGTSAIKAYMLGYKKSADGGGTWDASWTVVTTISSTATSGSRTFTPSSLAGIYNIGGWYKFAVWTIDNLDVYSNQAESNVVQCALPSACGAPTAVTLSPAIVETTLTLSWSGAANGVGNTITAYELQMSESPDNAAWSDWQSYTLVSSAATGGTYSGINAPTTRGAYRRLRIQARGSAGSDYYSEWAISNPAQRNIPPMPPTTFTAAPASYFDTPIQLTWSGTTAGTSAIKAYIIQYSTSSDENNWSGWSTLTTINSSSASGSYSTTPSIIDGMRTKYRIAVMDSLDAISNYVESNVVMKQLAPEAPIVVSPKQGSVTYSTQPRFLITTGGSPDGRTQKIAVKIDDGAWKDSDANPSFFSVSGMLANAVSTIFQPAALSAGVHTATFKAVNASGSSTEVTRAFTVATIPFEEVVQYKTVVTAAQMNALHSAINNVRAFYGIANMRWVDPIVAGKTLIRDWPLHIAELRTGVEGVIYLVNAFDTKDTFDVPIPNWISTDSASPRADVMNQMADVVASL